MADSEVAAIRPTAIPSQPVIDPAEWRGSELEGIDGWRLELNATELADLLNMSQAVKSKIGEDPNRLIGLSLGAFELGSFAHKLKTIGAALRDGPGVALLKGLPMQDLDPLGAAIIFWGIGQHLGQPVSNNPEGDLIGRVMDHGKDYSDPKVRGYQTSAGLEYHCDQCSIAALMCVRTAKSGGRSKLSSAIAVYNEMLSREPDLVEELVKPLYWTKHGEVDSGEKNYYTSPVFNFLKGYFCGAFGISHILKGHALPETPALTESQKEALELAESIADELHYEFSMEPGDVQFLNNFVTLHGRSDYVDWPDEHRKRLLWRLWLINEDLRPQTDYALQWYRGVKLTNASERVVLF